MALHIEDKLAKLEKDTLYGPWAWECVGDDNTCGIGVAIDEDERPIAGHIEDRESFVVEPVSAEIQGAHHAAFICAIRNATPALLAVVRTARLIDAIQRKVEAGEATDETFDVEMAAMIELRAVLAQLDALDAPHKAEG